MVALELDARVIPKVASWAKAASTVQKRQNRCWNATFRGVCMTCGDTGKRHDYGAVFTTGFNDLM